MSQLAPNLGECVEPTSYWSGSILGKMEIDPVLARYCYYRLQLFPGDGIGSAESAVLKTAVRQLVEALYANWETVVQHIPAKRVEAAIEELHSMAQISSEYPVMLWEYFEEGNEVGWVSRTLAKLPTLEAIKEFYELPHMRMMFINMSQQDFCDTDSRSAEKAYQRALADRNKRLNRTARKR